MFRPSRLTRRGDRKSSRVASRGCGGRGSVGRRKVRARAGSPCEPETARGRTALSNSSRQARPWPCHRAGASACEQADARTAKSRGPGRHCYGQALAEAIADPTGRAFAVNSKGEGGQKEVWLPGERDISRQTIAQGRPGAPASPVCCCAVFLRAYSRSRPRVPAGTRSSLRPLDQRVARPGKARAKCAARLRNCV